MYTPHVSVLISSGGVCMHPPTFRQLVEAYSSAHMEHKKLHLPSTTSKGPWSNTIGPKIGVWNPLLWGWPLTKINIFWVWILEFRLCILGFHWKTCNWKPASENSKTELRYFEWSPPWQFKTRKPDILVFWNFAWSCRVLPSTCHKCLRKQATNMSVGRPEYFRTTNMPKHVNNSHGRSVWVNKT